MPATAAPHSSHAVVLGASLTGLLAASVLARHCRRVTVVDRDPLDGDLRAPRRGAPQAKHTHGLLVGGLTAMDELLPGLSDELVRRGALKSDVLGDTTWIMRGKPVAMFGSDLAGLLGSRVLLESQVRARVRAIPAVTLLGDHDVLGLTATPVGDRVTGARVAPRSGDRAGETITLAADVVVDATGRGSRAPAWLAELGHGAPPCEEVPAGITYASRGFKDVPGLLDGVDAVVIGAQPGASVGGVALRQEGGSWIMTLTGFHGVRPPTDPQGFHRFAAGLPTPELGLIAAAAEPIGPAETFSFPVSRWRHYERMTRRPQGFVVVGDAVCSFNPVYGQGMSSAALQVVALAGELAGATGPDSLAAACAASAPALARVVKTPWSLATGGDRRGPGMAPKPGPERLLDRYLDRVVEVARHDRAVTLAFMRVLNLLDEPRSLLSPALAWRVLRPARG